MEAQHAPVGRGRLPSHSAVQWRGACSEIVDLQAEIVARWCQVTYGGLTGWVPAYYLIDGGGWRLSCMMSPPTPSCMADARVKLGPSFDCTNVTALDEIAICSSSALSQLDQQMGALYTTERSGFGVAEQRRLNEQQSAWLRRRAACQSNESCIADAYRSRIAELTPPPVHDQSPQATIPSDRPRATT